VDTLSIEWVAHNGTRWSLLDPQSPVCALSIQGMGLPAFEQQRRKLGSRDGSSYEGTTWNENSIMLTVKVGDEYVQPGFRKRRRGADWRELDRKFRLSFSAEHQGKLLVTSESGQRWMNLRLEQPLEVPPERNPAEIGSATYVLDLTADDEPWWIGEEISESFTTQTDNAAFLIPDPEPIASDEVGLYVAADGEASVARILNPGDRAAWPLWWAQGPANEVHIGLDEQYVVIPFTIAENQRVLVDSYRQSITDESGNSLWSLMGFTDVTFAAVPAGGEVPLHIRLLGAGAGARVGVTIVPRFDGPW
jgi:hypothetical protein